MTINFSELNNIQLDVLREIGNIGAGNAVSALAKMINRKIDMAVPKVKILEFKKISDMLNAPEDPVIGILLGMTGDITGNILFMLDKKSARLLVNMLFGFKESTSEDFDEIEMSAIKELGNIMTGSYVGALSMLTNLKILCSVPDVAIDMAGAILSVPAIEFGKLGESVLYIESEFNEGDNKVIGDFFLIPDIGSYETLLKTLGVII
ncbi:MAG TPA: chemotaxis protein CheC [Pseudobacteroides sp.]|uniref:chemotaxis protein CheC n=1 Tax=Pseudobacteroides sp. TaxID=1968840 RepID=UPI002F94A22C